MSGKSKSKTQIQTQIPKEYIQLQKLVVTRYSVHIGRKHLMSLKMKNLQPELKKMRRIKSTMEKALEEGDVNAFKKAKKEYLLVLKTFKEKAKPYDQRIKPLSKQVKYLDILIMNNPLIKPNLRPVTSIEEVPEELRVPQGGK